MLQADAYLSQGQYDMAIKQLTKALKKAPSYADAYFLRAKLYEAKGGYLTTYCLCNEFTNFPNISPTAIDYERSTADYLKIFSDLDPTNRTVFSKLLSTAMTYSYGGKYSQSVPILDKIIKNVEEVWQISTSSTGNMNLLGPEFRFLFSRETQSFLQQSVRA